MNKVPVLFENENLIAVEKPINISSIPERNNNAESVLQIIATTKNIKLFIVHRLDKEVSGVMLFAKKANVHKYLNLQFETRMVRKAYFGIIHGILPKETTVIDLPIREFGSGRMGVDYEKGKPSRTVFKMKESSDNKSLLLIEPYTGRRHQIRVHAYAGGFPLIGDTRYGNLRLQKKYPRLMLHAASIGFRDIDDQEYIIESKMPKSFRNLLSNNH